MVFVCQRSEYCENCGTYIAFRKKPIQGSGMFFCTVMCKIEHKQLPPDNLFYLNDHRASALHQKGGL